ncbi:hypothetical protein A2U01_0024118, partial [Trifolium medium]|nr:hypothetical protein [Trifolium medium]
CGCHFCYKCGSGYLPGGCECNKVKATYHPVQQNQQVPSTVLTGGVPSGGTFPFPHGYLTNMAQTPRQIPSTVSTTGVFTSGNFPNRNPPYSYQPQEQIFSGISGGVSTSGTFPYGYPINSAQRQEYIRNVAAYAAAYAVQRQQQIPSIASTTRPLPYGYRTYPIGGGVFTAGTLSN